MDPVTHTLVGVVMANAFFRRRIGPESVPILAIASNLPDLDAVVHLTGDPGAVLMRRTFGHSLFLVPFWVFLLALALRRRYSRPGIRALFALCLLGAAVHLFFDLITDSRINILTLGHSYDTLGAWPRHAMPRLLRTGGSKLWLCTARAFARLISPATFVSAGPRCANG